jgi:hypothetical protein
MLKKNTHNIFIQKYISQSKNHLTIEINKQKKNVAKIFELNKKNSGMKEKEINKDLEKKIILDEIKINLLNFY